MSEANRHISTYTLEDIRRYLDGRMSTGEMHALERAALDDPFLADAVDGMENLVKTEGKESIDKSIQELHKRLQEKIAAEKKISRGIILPVWAKSAAAIVLLLGIGWLADRLLMSRKPVQQNIAKSNESVPDSNTAASFAEKPRPDSLSQGTFKEEPNKARGQSAQKDSTHLVDLAAAPPKKNKVPVAGMASGEKRKPVQDEPVPSPPRNQKSEEADKISRQEEMSPSIKPLSAASVAADNHQFKGIVMDANSMPVRGATISLSNSNKKTKTNDKGEFTLDLNSNESLAQMEVDALGYSQRSYSIEKDQSGRKIITLEPDSSFLKEVVVSDYRAKKIRESKIDERNSSDINTGLAAPSNGWKAFYEWIDSNKKINKADSVLKGTEIISFQVERKGALSSFRSEQSISKAHFAEVIRLIKEGPAWTCLKGKKQRVTIYVNF